MSASKKPWIKPVVLSAVLLGATGIGVAAAKSNGWGHGHGHCGERHGGHYSGKSLFQPGRHVEGKLAFLKTELGITADQEPAWEDFADVVRRTDAARAEMIQARRERREAMGDDGERPALDERIDRGIAAMEQRYESFRDLASAAKTLYAKLTPEQQAIADDMLPAGRGRGRGHGRGFGFN